MTANELVTMIVDNATEMNKDIFSAVFKAQHVYVVQSVYVSCPVVFNYTKIGSIDFANDSDAINAGTMVLGVVEGADFPEWATSAVRVESCNPICVGDIVIEGNRIFRVDEKAITHWPI